MNTKNIIVKLSTSDTYKFIDIDESDGLYIQLDQNDKDKMANANLLGVLRSSKLVPNNNAYDLLHFALAVYTIDQVVSRQIYGFQGWSRHLIVNFPVHSLELWNGVKAEFSTFLSYLSGDKWEFNFRQSDENRTFDSPEFRNPDNFTKVSLFSGGLDSFIGAVDLLSEEEKPFLVSHYKNAERKVQDTLVGKLELEFGEERFKSQKFRVQPNQRNPSAESENSSRARSFLFITLGVVVAHCLSDDMELVLPENGLISLNIPLTMSRLSSHSTRTTHPYFIDGLNTIFEKIKLGNKIINPYRFKTKGEMISECLNPEFLTNNIPNTISCSHPEHSRFNHGTPGLNCGYCVPCIIRQSAENQAGEIITDYAIGDVRRASPHQKTKTGSDYRAFKIGLTKFNRIKERNSSLSLQIIRSGPVPYHDLDELNKYISVYKRGMTEVSRFLNNV